MPDIIMQFPVKASAARVFQAVSTPQGLDTWWTKRSTGEPKLGAAYELHFGPGYDWRARVTRCAAPREFELQVGESHEDWVNSRVAFHLAEKGGTTTVHFSHTGWPSANEHWRSSVYCWAMYLRIMTRNIEHDESVPYEKRLNV
jgi:uncharacterized protein YndB with AHSA1/START domain